MQNVLSITKALSDENRVNILMYLCKSEMCLCQIIDMLDLSPSTVSKHIKILLDAGLVKRRKEGRWHYYYLPRKEDAYIAMSAIRWIKKSLNDNGSVINNKEKLKVVLRRNRDEFCRQYKK